MGVSVFPEFNPRPAAINFEADGKILAAEFHKLDELAAELEVPLFSSFGDNREIPADFDGDLEELDELLGPWDEWFDAASGITTLRALIDALSSEAAVASRFEYPQEVLEELRELERCLVQAQGVGADFRLELG